MLKLFQTQRAEIIPLYNVNIPCDIALSSAIRGQGHVGDAWPQSLKHIWRPQPRKICVCVHV